MVSVVILTKNEEKSIQRCLLSVSWADEKIVIDDFSEDKTVEIAKSMGAIVFKHPLENNFARQRNFGLEKATGDWILFLDADERISHSLQYEITTEINDSLNTTRGYYMKRMDTVWGKSLKHGEVGAVSLLRLGRKDAGIWKGKVHEVWKVKGNTESLKHPLYHYPHQSIQDFLREVNYYSTLRAEELSRKKKRVRAISVIAYPLGKFLFNYFIRLGILDGVPGFVIASMMSFHSFLVRGKVWQYSKNH
jgi:glycosyltransferase involved in cell wall biosynthesis